MPAPRRSGVLLARLAVTALSAQFLGFALLLPRADRGAFGVGLVDLGPLCVVLATLGVAYALLPGFEVLKWAWVVGVSFVALGRMLTLFFLGSEDLDRAREYLGIGSWAVIFFAAQMAAVILTADRILTAPHRD